MYLPMRINDASETNFCKIYYDTTAEKCLNYNYVIPGDLDSVDVYVITFNNLFCVEYQIKSLKSFFNYKHNIIIVDNNNNLHPENSNKILEICKKENVTYIKAPNNYFQEPEHVDPTLKLGSTMNWIFQNCVKKRNTKYFGFLDQDCFLFKNFNIVEYLDKKQMYGPLSRSKKYPDKWNLHVTSNFYKYDLVKDLQLDFRASWKYELDTGGANYDILYYKFDFNEYDLDTKGFRYFDFDIGNEKTFQYYTIHDSHWVHMCGSSATFGEIDPKIAYMKGFLDSFILRNDKSF